MRRAKSVRNASDADLAALVDAASAWETWSVWVLLTGLALELVLVWAPVATPLTRIGETFADAMVVLGVWAEVALGNAGAAAQGEQLLRSAKQTEAANVRSEEAYRVAKIAVEELARSNERLANAEKEAAEARERTAEIEKLTAWRRVSPEQKEAISAEVQKIGAQNIDLLIEWQAGDPEAFLYSRALVGAFNRAGLMPPRLRWLPNSFPFAALFGLNWVTSSPEIDAGVFRKLLEPDVDAFVLLNIDLSKHLVGRNPVPTAPNLYVFVGPKRPFIDADAELAEMGIAITPKSDSDPNT